MPQVNFLFTLIGQLRVGNRPGRIEPRARKRRPKPYPWAKNTAGSRTSRHCGAWTCVEPYLSAICLKKQQGSVFLEDVADLEAQQRSIDANPHMKLRAFSIGAGGVRARHVIERMIKEQGSALVP
jgi:hypothetical protein